MRRIAATLAVLACVLTTPAAAAAKPPTCKLHRGYSVVTESAKAVISVRKLRIEDADGAQGVTEQRRIYRGCWRKTGREGRLADGYLVTGPGAYDEQRQEGFVLAGTFAAWTTFTDDKYGFSTETLRAWNLATKRQGRYAITSQLTPLARVRSFVLSPRGGLAFILAGGDSSSLWTLTARDAPAMFDEGGLDAIQGLTRSGRSISWTNAGEPQTIVFEPDS